MNNRKVKYGIIGFGRHAERRFIPAFAVSHKSELIAVQKRDRVTVERKKAHYNITKGFTDPLELVRDSEVEAVIIASPPGLHKEQAVMAAEAGKHVMVEKPMAVNAAECREMINACEQNGVYLFVALCMRYLKVIREVQRIISSGDLGKIIFARALFNVDASRSHRSWLTDPLVSGGGPVADLGAHLIDLLEYLLNDEISEVKPIVLPALTEEEIERQAVTALKFRGDTLAAIFTSFDLPREQCLGFYGNRAKLTVYGFSEIDSEINIEVSKPGDSKIITVENKNHFLDMIDSFTGSIISGSPVEIPGSDGLHNQSIIDQIYNAG